MLTSVIGMDQSCFTEVSLFKRQCGPKVVPLHLEVCILVANGTDTGTGVTKHMYARLQSSQIKRVGAEREIVTFLTITPDNIFSGAKSTACGQVNSSSYIYAHALLHLFGLTGSHVSNEPFIHIGDRQPECGVIQGRFESLQKY